jgi:hypothetical protein
MYDTSILARGDKLYFFKRIHITPNDEELGIIMEDVNETNTLGRS